MFPASKLEVDHVEQAGSCNSWETAYEFLYKLLDCNDNWVLTCKPCHKIKSYAERMDISFAEAYVAKKAIEVMKLPKQKLLDWLQQKEYNVQTLTNNSLRRKAVEDILRKEMNNAS